MGLRKVGLGLYLLLLLWFTLDLFGIPDFVIRDNLLSTSGLLELLLVLILIGYLQQWKATPLLSFAVLGLWGFLQYISHWYGFFFGISVDKLKRYYTSFAGMYRFFPESEARLIPDAYHTILGILLAINLVLVVIQIVLLFRRIPTQVKDQQVEIQ